MELTREEQYLAYLSGTGTEPPNPITRKERLLYKIAMEGGGGGLKTLEAATIGELYDQITALDNPVLFRVTTDGSFSFYRSNGAKNEASFTSASLAGLTMIQGVLSLNITDYDFVNSCNIRTIITSMDGNLYVAGVRESETIHDFDFSNVTKFTAYYF